MEGLSGVTGSQAMYNTKSPNNATLKGLQEQYSDLNISAQSFGSESAIRNYAMKQSGKYNVAIDPRALSRMENDEDFSQKIHGVLSGVKEQDDRHEQFVNGYGATLVATGTIIDKDGNVGQWSVSQTKGDKQGGGKQFASSTKSHQEFLEELEEKHQERLEEQKRREKKKIELQESATTNVVIDSDSENADSSSPSSSASGGLNVVG